MVLPPEGREGFVLWINPTGADLTLVVRWANGFVPEGQSDRSLARSAWDRATQKSRPVGYGLIRADGPIGTRSYRTLRDSSLGPRPRLGETAEVRLYQL
jgi:hypothetical protein